MVGTGEKVAIGFLAVLAGGITILAVARARSAGTTPPPSGIILSINGSAGPVTVPANTPFTFAVTGGTPNGPLTVYGCPAPVVSGSCTQTSVGHTGQPYVFDASGNWTHTWSLTPRVIYLAVMDASTGDMSNFVEVTVV